MTSAVPLLRPDWPSPPGVEAAMSLREGGVSTGPWHSLNLSFGVGDDTAAVTENRRRWTQALGVQPRWMRQVHGSSVQRLRANDDLAAMPTADAAWSSDRGVACTVGAADCMPVFLALADGAAVAAAHAGWRGLAGGVLQATVQALCQGMGAAPRDCVAWLGPCIGPEQFEVTDNVLQAFGATANTAAGMGFVAQGPRDGALRWLASLPQLANSQLQAAGVQRVFDCGRCTVSEPSAFFSFRRDSVTGRHAAAIWRS